MKFNTTDKNILIRGLDRLSMWEKQVLIYRFWENLSIEEISRLMGLKWSEVDQSIERSYVSLREYCLNDSEFSLSEQTEEAA